MEIWVVSRSDFHKLSWLSILAAVMSFSYSSIGLALSIAKVAGGGAHPKTTMTGTTVGVDVTGSEKIWRTFQSILSSNREEYGEDGQPDGGPGAVTPQW